jgi:hypothetical protein
LNESDASEHLQDLGWVKADADIMAHLAVIRGVRMRAQYAQGWTPTALKNAYAWGVIPEAKVREEAIGLYLEEKQISGLLERADADREVRMRRRAATKALTGTIRETTASFRAGVIGPDEFTRVMLALGFPQPAVDAIRSAESANASRTASQRMLAAVKRAFLQGKFDEQRARTSMAGLGISPPRIDSYISEWNIEYETGEKLASVTKNISWYVQGLITEEQLRMALKAANVLDADLAVYIAEARAKLDEREGRIQLALQRRTSVQAAQLQKALKTTERQRTDIQRRLKALTPVGLIERMLRSGIHSYQWGVDRLMAIGYPRDTAEQIATMAEVKKERAAPEILSETAPPPVPEGRDQTIFPTTDGDYKRDE